MADIDAHAARLTEQFKGQCARDLSDGGKTKTIEQFDAKNGPSGEDTLLIAFTDGTWAYATQTEQV